MTPSGRWRAVIFDLDGTLLDTLADLADSMNRVLAGWGFPPHPRREYRYLVGAGMLNLARRALPPDRRQEELAVQVAAAMREEYGRHWQDATLPYPGIPELLAALRTRGLKLAVLSNKPDEFTKIMVGAYFPVEWFSLVEGALPSRPLKPHPAGAVEIAARLHLAPRECLYCGDTDIDMETAQAAGMFPVGVLWGFRRAEELVAHGARALIDVPAELLPLVDNVRNFP